MRANIGDTARVTKSVLGKRYRTEGIIDRLQYDQVYGTYIALVAGDWWLLTNDLENHFEIVQPRDARCRLCGESNVEMTPVDVVQNYNENGRPDDGGCFSEHHTEWQCADDNVCRARRAEQWELMKTIAHFADQEAAEDGRSGIGRGGVG